MALGCHAGRIVIFAGGIPLKDEGRKSLARSQSAAASPIDTIALRQRVRLLSEEPVYQAAGTAGSPCWDSVA